MNNILLTGANGFLGKLMFKQLKGIDTKIHSLGRHDCDSNTDLSVEIPKFSKTFDTVIHAAGKAHITPSNEKEQQKFYQVNFEGTKNLIAGLERSGLPGSFIFISTVSVYGCWEGVDILEEYPLNGDSPYAESKKRAEEFLLNWGKEKGVIIGILRLPLVAGPNPTGNLGAMINGIKTGKYYSIRGNEAKKSMVNGKDITSILEPLSTKGGIYNLSDGYHPNVYELEEVIAKGLNKKIKSIPGFVAKRVARIGDVLGSGFPLNSGILKKLTSTLTFSDQKARNELGWTPTPVLQYLSEIIK